VAATAALGRDVPMTAPYPHVCHFQAPGAMTSRVVTFERKECGACGDLQSARIAARAAKAAAEPPADPGGGVP
jgi:hypothetical protein